MLTLYVLSGPEIGKTCELLDGSVLGRAPSGDHPVPVRESSVSRSHARIEKRGGDWFVVDLDSRNGLRHDGERVSEVPLSDGTEFALGDLELRVRVSEPEASPREQVRLGAPAELEPAPEPAPAPVPEPEPEPAADDGDPFGDDDDEISLEEDFDFDALPPVPKSEPAPRKEPPGVPTGLRSGGAPTPAPRPAPKQTARPPADLARTKASRRPVPSNEPQTRRKVLQYNRVENRSGLFSTDLAQRSGWVRFLVMLLVVAVFVGLCYGAYRATVMMRGRGGPQRDVPVDEEVRQDDPSDEY